MFLSSSFISLLRFMVAILLCTASAVSFQGALAWNYTLSLKRDKRVAVVLGVFGHTEFGKTQVSLTNLLLQDASGKTTTQFTSKAWLELRKVKSVSVAKKLKKQIEKEDVTSCDEVENVNLGGDGDDSNIPKPPSGSSSPSSSSLVSTTTAGPVLKHYLRYLKTPPSEDEPDLRVTVTFTAKEAGLYALFFARCISPPTVKIVASVASIKVSQFNPKYVPVPAVGASSSSPGSSLSGSFTAATSGIEIESTYLSVGETPLPTMYGGFAVIFSIGTFFWYRELSSSSSASPSASISATSATSASTTKKKPAGVMKIHFAMLFLGILKSVTLFLQAAVYAHRNSTGGTGALVDVVFVVVGAVKTAVLFVIVILLGTGWSISKAVVTEREQKLILVVLILQLIVNIALASLEEDAPLGTETVDRLRLGLRVLDLLCALVVLAPIISRAKSQHETAVHRQASSEVSAADAAGNSSGATAKQQEVDEDAISFVVSTSSSDNHSNNNKETQRLKTFRTFYLSTFIFLYFTRLVVPYLEAHLSYLWLWVPHLAYELAALIFYVTACKLFHPSFTFRGNTSEAEGGTSMVVVSATNRKSSDDIHKSSSTGKNKNVVNPNELEELDLS